MHDRNNETLKIGGKSGSMSEVITLFPYVVVVINLERFMEST